MVKYDVAVIGGGHNGLVLAAYLTKAGLKVVVVERRFELGGGLCTEEVTLPGFRHNLHSMFHMMSDVMPAWEDLELAKYGVSYVKPEVQVAMPLQDGRSITLYRDLEKTCSSIANFSKKDAEAYRKMYLKFKEYMDEILIPATYVPTMPPGDLITKMSQSELGKEFLAVSELSAKEIVDQYFEDEHVKTLMLYLACMWGIRYDETGMGFLIPLYLNRATNYSLVVGGSHRLASALYRIVMRNGGKIIDNEEVSKIIVEDGVAKGVVMDSGKAIEANVVASSVDPPQTFLRMVGGEHLDHELVEAVKNWRWEETSLYAVHLAFNEAPKYKAGESNPDVDKALLCIVGYESLDKLLSHWNNLFEGRVEEEPGGNCTCPSLYDSTQAPEGKHTGLFETDATYRLKNGGGAMWDRIRLSYSERCVETWRRYAANVNRENILGKYVYTPLDIERKLSDMVEGSFKQGSYTPLQMGYFRPNDRCSQHRTPIFGLYLCGSSCYPGGMITAGPGYNAAGVIMEDLGGVKWWKTPEYVVRAREKNLI